MSEGPFDAACLSAQWGVPPPGAQRGVPPPGAQWGVPPDDIFATVIALARLEAPRLCAAAADSLRSGGRPALQRHAHTLKGVAGNICAVRLAALADLLSDAALTAPPPALEVRLAAVVAEWRRVADVIDAGGPYG
jgi:hypothetical protein